MQKSHIIGVFGLTTLVLAIALVVLLPEAGTMAWSMMIGSLVVLNIVATLVGIKLHSDLATTVESSEKAVREANDALEAIKAKMSEVTTIDELTGCYNRRHFLDVLQQHSAMSGRGNYQFTVAVTQVDQFGDIIESEGLGRGNEVLQLFARIVKAALREVDVIARLEGDQFGLLLSGCSEEDALNIINRISVLIGQIQVTEANDIKITTSGGLTSYHGTESAEDLVAHAEQALSFAVEQGRDRVAGYLYHAPEEEAPAS